jgi:hypothetical protein
MVRERAKTAGATDAPATEAGGDIFDEQAALRQQEEAARQAKAVVQQVATSTELTPEHGNGHATHHAPHQGHAASVEQKKYTPPKDPFGFENIKAGENRVQLLKCEGEGAWVIRFAHNPNLDKGLQGETYSKEQPHPVLKMLKEEGYRWGFDGGDGKAWQNDPYGTDHMEARRVLQKAAEMIGAPTQGQGRIPD